MSDKPNETPVTNRDDTLGPPGTKRDKNGVARPPPLTKAQRITLQDKALELNLQGYSYGKIATFMSAPEFQKALGIVPRPIPKVMAFRLVDKALEETREERDEKAERKRQRELYRLNAIFLSNWGKRDQPRHAEVLLKISTRRAKLEGLDAPTRVRHEGEVQTTPGLPLSMLTDEELEAYEKLATAVAGRMAASGAAAAAPALPAKAEPEADEEDEEPEES